MSNRHWRGLKNLDPLPWHFGISKVGARIGTKGPNLVVGLDHCGKHQLLIASAQFGCKANLRFVLGLPAERPRFNGF